MDFDEVYEKNREFVCQLVNEGEFTKYFPTFERMLEILDVTKNLEVADAIKILNEITKSTKLTDLQSISLLLHLDICFKDRKSLHYFITKLPNLLPISPNNLFTSIYNCMNSENESD